jgi:hypothetical protein
VSGMEGRRSRRGEWHEQGWSGRVSVVSACTVLHCTVLYCTNTTLFQPGVAGLESFEGEAAYSQSVSRVERVL